MTESRYTDSDSDFNPFAVSSACREEYIPDLNFTDVEDFRVSGGLLICGPHVILPPVCIRTGSLDASKMITRTAQFPNFRLVVAQKTCSVTWWITDEEYRKSWRRRLKLSTIAVLPVVAVGLLMAMLAPSSSALLFVAGIITLLILALLDPLRKPQPSLVRYQEPGIYYVKGLPDSYLELIDRHRQARLNAEPSTSSAPVQQRQQ